jgi:glycosyltransferase involved in cell wall biosynthesis
LLQFHAPRTADLTCDPDSGTYDAAPRAGAATRLRVCHLGKFYPPAAGGIETHLQTLAHAQARLGMSVQVICVNHLDKNDADVTWQPLARTPTIVEADGRVRTVRLGRRASLARLEVCLGLPRWLWHLAAGDFDLLHVHVPNPTMILGLYCFRPRIPWVVTFHSDVVRQKVLRLLQRPFESWVFERARRIVATSPAYLGGSTCLQQFQDRVDVVPFGIELDQFTQPDAAAQRYARELRREQGQPLWLAVGRLVYYKGLHNAIRALARVPGQLMIVGHGPLRGELDQLAREQGVADRIIWRDHLSQAELIGAYHAATALWFPSNARSEAFGFVQIEAMACGCPVINTAIPGSGVPWVSRHNESGLTIPVDDWQALADAANLLWHDGSLRVRLGRQARARALAEFDVDLMARRTLGIYQQALGRAPAPLSSPCPEIVQVHRAEMPAT